MKEQNKDVWIAGIARGHNGSVCLLKNGKIVFSIEEERISRQKYDGGPLAAMLKILDYTTSLDYIVIAHTQKLQDTAGKIDFSGEDIYTGLARKLGLINRHVNLLKHPQVIDMSMVHHKLHAACAFYRSGFLNATAVVVDGAGTFIPLKMNNEEMVGWETESIFECDYPHVFTTVYKHIGIRGPAQSAIISDFSSEIYNEAGHFHECVISERAGITKIYEAVTQYCGWSSIEAGKTMGLFPYGKLNKNIPPLFDNSSIVSLANRNIVIPTYPNGALINNLIFDELKECPDEVDYSTLDSRRDLAYACQHETQHQVLELIKLAVEKTGNKNVVLSGGYGLNCVANYHYLTELNELGINLYVEPISNDAGTAIGAALLFHHSTYPLSAVDYSDDGLYLGFDYNYSVEYLDKFNLIPNINIVDADYSDIVSLLRQKNIVALFQGRSENGPRALGNRSILFDPTFDDGKDFVNQIKHREYFRPFAGSILEEHVNEWFDLRGMNNSPFMMYAVNCKEGVESKIPAIIHIDGTCRIQTVTSSQNFHFYNLINEFYKQTNVPILFNTSFNLGGEPLVETLDDAINTLVNSEIEYLYLPELGKLIKIEN